MNTHSSKKIKFLALDFDGILTNNKVIIDENGKESVICNRSDGLAIDILKKNGIEIIVISKEKNSVVEVRCKKLGIHCIHGVDDKLQVLKKEIKKRGFSYNEVCFVGNDVNDLDCIQYAGIGIAPNDAFPEVKKKADFVTKRNGGEGVIREIIGILHI